MEFWNNDRPKLWNTNVLNNIMAGRGELYDKQNVSAGDTLTVRNDIICAL